MLFLWYIVLVLGITIIWLKISNRYQYWKIRNVLHVKPVLGFGNTFMMDFLLGKSDTRQNCIGIHNSFENARYYGTYLFFKPMLHLKDINLIKQVFVKDFNYFIDRNFIGLDEESDAVVGRSVLFLKGQKWKKVRATISPAFSSSKIRALYIFMIDISERVANFYDQKCNTNNPLIVDMADVSKRFNADLLATCVFGLKTDSFSDETNDFFKMTTKMCNLTIISKMKLFGFLFSKKLMKYFNISFLSNDINMYFRNLVNSIVEIRQKNGIFRPDMINVLMEVKKGLIKDDINIADSKIDAGYANIEESLTVKEKTEKIDLTDDDLIAQTIMFIVGTFETTSTLLSFMAHELATHLDIQRKLQEEIDEVMKNCNGKISYETILKMKYLDMVVSETLRMWPPIVAVDRICTQDYTIHPEQPNETSYTLEKGISISIGIYAIHMDSKYWSEPQIFNPERFNEDNKKNIVPYTFIPFGLGPRSCIATRFVLLNTKAFFVHLLSKFDITCVKETQHPIILQKRSILLVPEKGFQLGFKRRQR